MASTQCHKPAANKTCQQKCHSSSLGQKVSEMASWITGSHRGQAHCHSGAQAQAYPSHATSKSETHCYSQGHKTNKKRSEHKKKDKNLLQKMKDGVSCNSDSSSDSESDNEGSHKRKN